MQLQTCGIREACGVGVAVRLAPDLSFARELQPRNIELTGFGGVAVIGTMVVECPVVNVAAY